MHRWLTATVLTGLTAAPVYAAAPAPPLTKIAIVVLSKDAVRAVGIESDLKNNFSQRGVQADSLHSLFPNKTTASEIMDQLKAQKYEGLLCIAPRKTIRITTPDYTSRVSSLKACLETYSTGAFPTGEPLDVNPFALEEQPIATTAPQQGSLRSPIPTNPQAASFRLYKGTLRLFSLSSNKLLWETKAQAKAPAEMRDELQNKLIVNEIWSVIQKSDVFPIEK